MQECLQKKNLEDSIDRVEEIPFFFFLKLKNHYILMKYLDFFKQVHVLSFYILSQLKRNKNKTNKQ